MYFIAGFGRAAAVRKSIWLLGATDTDGRIKFVAWGSVLDKPPSLVSNPAIALGSRCVTIFLYLVAARWGEYFLLVPLQRAEEKPVVVAVSGEAFFSIEQGLLPTPLSPATQSGLLLLADAAATFRGRLYTLIPCRTMKWADEHSSLMKSSCQ